MKKIRKIIELYNRAMDYAHDWRWRQRIEDWIDFQCQRLVEFIISITITGFVFFLLIAFLYWYIGPENIR